MDDSKVLRQFDKISWRSKLITSRRLSKAVDNVLGYHTVDAYWDLEQAFENGAAGRISPHVLANAIVRLALVSEGVNAARASDIAMHDRGRTDPLKKLSDNDLLDGVVSDLVNIRTTNAECALWNILNHPSALTVSPSILQTVLIRFAQSNRELERIEYGRSSRELERIKYDRFLSEPTNAPAIIREINRASLLTSLVRSIGEVDKELGIKLLRCASENHALASLTGDGAIEYVQYLSGRNIDDPRTKDLFRSLFAVVEKAGFGFRPNAENQREEDAITEYYLKGEDGADRLIAIEAKGIIFGGENPIDKVLAHFGFAGSDQLQGPNVPLGMERVGQRMAKVIERASAHALR